MSDLESDEKLDINHSASLSLAVKQNNNIILVTVLLQGLKHEFSMKLQCSKKCSMIVIADMPKRHLTTIMGLYQGLQGVIGSNGAGNGRHKRGGGFLGTQGDQLGPMEAEFISRGTCS